MKVQRILVGLDASPRAPMVLRAAIQIAQSAGAKLLLFRGVGLQPEIPVAALAMSPEGVTAMLEETARRELDGFAREVPSGLLEGVRAEVGTPWSAICEAAKSEKVDLIVIGSHGYGALDRLLGTTAAKVVNHADRSVLVVRPRPE